jgi:hypothetical protein
LKNNRGWVKEEHGADKAEKLLSQPWDASLGRGAVVGIIKELGQTFKCEREEERGEEDAKGCAGEKGGVVLLQRTGADGQGNDDEWSDCRDGGRGLGLQGRGADLEEIERRAILKGVLGKYLTHVSDVVSILPF